MNLLIAAVFIMPTILYIMNIIYLKENRKGMYEPDRHETTTLLIFNSVMLVIGIAAVAFFIFLSLFAFDDPDVKFLNLAAIIAIGIGLFLYLIGVNIYFIWQLIKLLQK